jgi:bifunctional UDP-N-acetylglucosamine pyrophosphorylase / glucosamine-1-phosphate N-acetyltransferase
MRSRTPKTLHDLCGRPMIDWPIAAAFEAGAGKVVVVGGADGALQDRLPHGVELVVQPRPDGTGGAVLAAAEHLATDAPVLVINGDVQLVTAGALTALVADHAAGRAAATVVSMMLDDPAGYGRVVRGPGGTVERVVETKHPGDATADELAIAEVNAGIYAFDGRALLNALRRVGGDNAQGEIYLPAVLEVLGADGARVAVHPVRDAGLVLGVNDQVELAHVRGLAQCRIQEAHMRAGVTIGDPATAQVDVDVRIGSDTVLEPSTLLRGATTVGERCIVGPMTTVTDSTLGDEVTVLHSYLMRCEVRSGGTVGPFAYLRPDALLREGAKAGTFVEIKNSDIGEGTKVPHLSYVGDTQVGPGSNLGAATITANYDGRRKHRTTIGANVRTSVDTTLVAPVTVGDGAFTGAGSVVTEDVPPGALAIARPRQTIIEGYAERRGRQDVESS